MENGKLRVTEVVEKTERVEIAAVGGRYKVTGKMTTVSGEVTRLTGGCVTSEDGRELASVIWGRHESMSVQYAQGCDIVEVSVAINELIKAMTAPVEVETANEEGGEA